MSTYKFPQTEPIDFSRPLDLSVIKGKTALVTGGGSGIGLGICTTLAKHGAFVVICDQNEATGSEAEARIKAEGGNAKFIKTDVASWDSQVAAFKETIKISGNQLDVMIPCAGVSGTLLKLRMDPPGQTLDPTADPIRPPTSVFEVNLLGVYYSIALATHYFRTLGPQRKDPAWKPQLVLVSSIAGYIGLVGSTDYNGAKFGVRGMFKAIQHGQKSLGGDMQTNMLAPSFVTTSIHGPLQPFIEAAGIKFASVDDAVAAVMRFICDDTVHGRAVCVIPSEKIPGDRNFDLKDDMPDGDAATVLYDKFMNDNVFGPPAFYFTDLAAVITTPNSAVTE